MGNCVGIRQENDIQRETRLAKESKTIKYKQEALNKEQKCIEWMEKNSDELLQQFYTRLNADIDDAVQNGQSWCRTYIIHPITYSDRDNGYGSQPDNNCSQVELRLIRHWIHQQLIKSHRKGVRIKIHGIKQKGYISYIVNYVIVAKW